MDTIISPGGSEACAFLIAQVSLGTNLPPSLVIAQLTRFAGDITLRRVRVEAAETLARVAPEAGATALRHLVTDSALDEWARMTAAHHLSTVNGHQGDARSLCSPVSPQTRPCTAGTAYWPHATSPN
ncbi:hypothetical protein [Streptomyces sp. NPDC059893]|uniref:hypothetical protein n=1 Tax=Streptomyces sp. NPDC059893 TaxID=3346990 RepID=UPI003659C709